MSFLDTICCAFGAVILLYMILNAQSGRTFQDDTSDLRAEVDKLEEQVLEGYKDLVVLRNALTAPTRRRAPPARPSVCRRKPRSSSSSSPMPKRKRCRSVSRSSGSSRNSSRSRRATDGSKAAPRARGARALV
jgi:hypothetical protein